VVSRRPAALLRRAADASRRQLRQFCAVRLGNLYLKEALRVREDGADASALAAARTGQGELSQRADGAIPTVGRQIQPGTGVAPGGRIRIRTTPGAPQILTASALTTMRALPLGLP